MPGQVLVVTMTLECIALWETVGKVDWPDAYWGFPPNQYISENLQILLVFTYSILHSTFW